jgi:ferredoxin-NADP reductase
MVQLLQLHLAALGVKSSSPSRSISAPCRDAGPWLCVEDGCPAPTISCDILRSACRSRFSDIWSTVPNASLQHALIADECRATCGECSHMCKLIEREVLVPADDATGTLAVHRLRFALPLHSVRPGPFTHVKVRAPDAPGQRMRVRAYTALFATASFNLTVKIYPGEPPRTRGTSAYLGELAVGDWLHVPEVRAMESAMSPHEVRRAGMVAFGVGVVECLEPLEHLLAAGAQVRLVVAMRYTHERLYDEELRRLLAAHPSSLSIRYCLSREALQDGSREHTASVQVSPNAALSAQPLPFEAGERATAGRLSRLVVQEEFGAWADEALYLVVGTGVMERAVWTWLGELRVERRHHLLRGVRGWQPLVPTATSRHEVDPRARRDFASGAVLGAASSRD